MGAGSGDWSTLIGSTLHWGLGTGDRRLRTGDWIGAYVRGVLPREVQKVKESLEIANYKFPRDGSTLIRSTLRGLRTED